MHAAQVVVWFPLPSSYGVFSEESKARSDAKAPFPGAAIVEAFYLADREPVEHFHCKQARGRPPPARAAASLGGDSRFR